MKRLFLIGVILSMIAVSLTAMDDNLLVAKKGEAANHIPGEAICSMSDKAKESAGINKNCAGTSPGTEPEELEPPLEK